MNKTGIQQSILMKKIGEGKALFNSEVSNYPQKVINFTVKKPGKYIIQITEVITDNETY